ncbi:DNA-directed RNA polymerase specialized sigma subunit, sigma24 homolog [Pelotomaculum thermopropionicum SI]|uniref:DNA-directed RNA polymerase specialized sigma subunit, sigma24 homolog n=1 Tax=Pelotomaculum thermopropionicum (strain DSM 13744 / JCM 10971 / SI) TaxID=370438 RepID=A5D0C6_PELTS|nr:DNA-directed RNA polymerase specialized sigma subunit, sigma24 homolog [Pelotomaculum thermopropionicum SI]
MHPADEILVERSQNGDLEAFEMLVRRYENKVYTVAYRFLGNHADASDLAQEAFLRLYQALPRFRGESSFMTWLYRITANACRDELRRRQRNSTVSLDGENGLEHIQNYSLFSGYIPSPEDTVEKKELNELVQMCLNSISGEHRLILVMREIQGMTYDEISAVMNCSLGTVKSRLSRARRAFREKFNGLKELMELTSRQEKYGGI